MPELLRETSFGRKKISAVALARVAEAQWGVVSRRQLHDEGLGDPGIGRWVRDGQLHRVHRGVYALGHRSLSVEGRLAAAVLWAGPGALLSHTTAAYLWGVLDAVPKVIHISSPRRLGRTKGIRVHNPRELDGTTLRGFPVTTVARALLDLASMLQFRDLRKALAEADYRRLLDVEALRTTATRGRPGGRAIRKALARHQPLLARARSDLEILLIELCEDYGLPMPEVNLKIAGLTVDAVWRAQHVAVEVDGGEGHGTPYAARRDRRRELTLRGAGYRIIRYTWDQVTTERSLVARDLAQALA